MKYTPNVDDEFEEAIRGNVVKPIKKIDVSTPAQEDFEDILRIFRTPEYKARQQEAIKEEQRRQAMTERPSFKNNHGRVSNINTDALKKKNKLGRFGAGATLIVGLGILATVIIGRINTPVQEPVVVPDGYVQLIAAEQVDHGDSVYSIASEYYDSDVYSSMYETLEDYVDVIIDGNNLSYDGDITPYDTLSIPVLVDVDNACYQELKTIESAIQKIKEEAYWVDYTVEFGDSLSSIAARASGSYGETISLVNEIMSKNKLSNSLIYQGQQLKIVNPELGPLKLKFNEMQQALYESVKVESTQK